MNFGRSAIRGVDPSLTLAVPRRYDVELFQKIEVLTGKKMELFDSEQV